MNNTFCLAPLAEHDLTRWSCRERQEFKVELIELVKPEEVCIPGYIPGVIHGWELMARAHDLEIKTGLLHAEAMLRNQERIPKDWRHYFLVFPGQIWEDKDGMRYIVCLTYDLFSECWCIDCCSRLKGGFGSNVRLVHAR